MQRMLGYSGSLDQAYEESLFHIPGQQVRTPDIHQHASIDHSLLFAVSSGASVFFWAGCSCSRSRRILNQRLA